MIIRKPYAFLIKHFKLIHILLTALMIMFFLKMRSITNFLNEYISTGTFRRMIGVVSKYFGIWGFLLPIIIIAILIIIMYLLIKKQKPVKYYIGAIIAYIIEIIIMAVAYNVLSSIEQGEASATFIKIFRDLISIMSYLPIVFTLTPLARGVGFNIKHFNFQKDLIELDIEEADREEVELEVKVDTENIKAKINRNIRFIKYAYLENKSIFLSIFAGIIIAVAIIITSSLLNREKIYKEKETFNSNGIVVTINNSYKTNLGCDGNTIKDNKFYVIINMTIKNLYDAKVELPYDEIYLRLTENEKVSPIDDYLEEFADFGYRFISRSRLEAQEEREAVLVYEVSNDYENNSFRLEYFDSKTNDNGKITYNYKKVTLTPQEFNEVETISEKKLGETLSLDNSFLTGTSIKIDEAEIANRFTYEYTLSNGNKVNKVISSTDESAYKKTILRLKVELITNDELYSKVYSNFYGNFAKIEYEIDGTIYHQKSKIINLTTTGSAYTYLEIENKAINANKVSLVFTIRDKEYKYLLIEKE